jgi:hypothetical protein
MQSAPRFPRSYENLPVRRALEAIAVNPSLDGLNALLAAALKGGLVVDLTGSNEQSGTFVRTIESTAGEPVLPLFTSMKELEKAVAGAGGKGQKVQATILPAREALGLITSAEFVAVQFNPGGTGALVVARDHIEQALGE